MAGRIANGVGEKLDPNRVVTDGVQRARDSDHPTGDDRGRHYWIVLQIIRAGVDVAIVVKRDPVAIEVDAQKSVGVN